MSFVPFEMCQGIIIMVPVSFFWLTGNPFLTMTVNDSKMGTSTYNIDKLTEDNYSSWAQQIKWIVDEMEALDIVEGKEKKPVGIDDFAM